MSGKSLISVSYYLLFFFFFICTFFSWLPTTEVLGDGVIGFRNGPFFGDMPVRGFGERGVTETVTEVWVNGLRGRW